MEESFQTTPNSRLEDEDWQGHRSESGRRVEGGQETSRPRPSSAFSCSPKNHFSDVDTNEEFRRPYKGSSMDQGISPAVRVRVSLLFSSLTCSRSRLVSHGQVFSSGVFWKRPAKSQQDVVAFRTPAGELVVGEVIIFGVENGRVFVALQEYELESALLGPRGSLSNGSGPLRASLLLLLNKLESCNDMYFRITAKRESCRRVSGRIHSVAAFHIMSEMFVTVICDPLQE